MSQARPWGGALLLCLALLLGWSTRFHGSFVDEGDNLAVARLLGQGHLLYRTLFSHHFPFPYYWLAATFALLGPSIESARLSLLLFQGITFALTMVASRLYLTLGLVVLGWNAVALFYFGNLAIYQSFSAIALVPIFVLTLLALCRTGEWAMPGQLLYALFASVALLSTPLAALPVTISLLALLLVGKGREVLLISLLMGMGGGLYLLYLLVIGALPDFYHSTILFNLEVYARYKGAGSVNSIEIILDNVLTALHLFDSERSSIPIEVLSSYHAAGRWLLSGIAYKAAVLLTSLALLSRHRYLAALFIYLFTASLLIRERAHFDQISLVMVALCALSFLATEFRHTSARARLARGIGWVAAGVLVAWVGSGLYYSFTYSERMTYEESFAYYLSMSERISALSCGQPVHLGVYPGNPYFHFFSDLPPISKYPFMWPWVADIALDQEVAALRARPLALVYFNREGSVWGIPNKASLDSLDVYLAEHYVPAEGNFYLSPALHQRCYPLLQ